MTQEQTEQRFTTAPRALVLSGGGAKGAFEAGVVMQLAQDGQDYDLLCGVSTGALGVMVLGRYGFYQSAQRLVEYYESFRGSKDVYRGRGLWGALRGGLKNLKPLQKQIALELTDDAEWQRDVLIGVVEMVTGKYYAIRLNDHFDDPRFQTAMVTASCSFPPFFAPVKFRNGWYQDGGLRNITPLKAAIDYGCEEIDIVLATPLELPRWKPRSWTWDIIARDLSIVTNEIYRNDVAVALQVNRLAEQAIVAVGPQACGKRCLKIRVFEPNLELWARAFGEKIPYIGTLDFDPKQIGRAIRHGQEIAQRVTAA